MRNAYDAATATEKKLLSMLYSRGDRHVAVTTTNAVPVPASTTPAAASAAPAPGQIPASSSVGKVCTLSNPVAAAPQSSQGPPTQSECVISTLFTDQFKPFSTEAFERVMKCLPAFTSETPDFDSDAWLFVPQSASL
jgi:hypothetical protein